MKKLIRVIIFIVFTWFLSTTFVFAQQKSVKFGDKTYTYDDSTTGLYCGKQASFWNSGLWETIGNVFGKNSDFEGCIKVYKNSRIYTQSTESYTYDTDTTITNRSGMNAEVKLNTSVSDPVTKDDSLWWANLRFCVYNNGADGTAALFTDYMSTKIDDNDKRALLIGKCVTLKVQEVDKDKQVNACNELSERYADAKDLADSYKNDKKTTTLTKYKVKIEEMRTMCSQVVKFADYDDACVATCIDLEKNIYELDQSFGLGSKGDCGFSAKLIAWILNILKWIKYIVPVVVIVLGSLDFIKATASEKDDDMKKAQGNFVKRLIAAALIFLIPLLIEFILPKLGFDYYSCSIF